MGIASLKCFHFTLTSQCRRQVHRQPINDQPPVAAMVPTSNATKREINRLHHNGQTLFIAKSAKIDTEVVFLAGMTDTCNLSGGLYGANSQKIQIRNESLRILLDPPSVLLGADWNQSTDSHRRRPSSPSSVVCPCWHVARIECSSDKFN